MNAHDLANKEKFHYFSRPNKRKGIEFTTQHSRTNLSNAIGNW